MASAVAVVEHVSVVYEYWVAGTAAAPATAAEILGGVIGPAGAGHVGVGGTYAAGSIVGAGDGGDLLPSSNCRPFTGSLSWTVYGVGGFPWQSCAPMRGRTLMAIVIVVAV
jgi:hypothetical protein